MCDQGNYSEGTGAAYKRIEATGCAKGIDHRMVIINVSGNREAALRKFTKVEINRETRIKAEQLGSGLDALGPVLLSLFDRHTAKMN